MPTQKVISFGPREFSQGLSPLQLDTADYGGFFANATGIDPYRFPGSIAPGPLPSSFTGLTIDSEPYTIEFIDQGFYKGFLLCGNKIIRTNPDGTLGTSHTYTAGTVTAGHSIVLYMSNIYYFLDGDIGKFDGSTTWDDDWGSTVPTGGGALSNGAGFPHRALNANGLIYFTNANNIGTYNGTTNTLNRTFFQVPTGMVAKDIRLNNQGKIEIYCERSAEGGLSYAGGVQVLVWDGVSTLPDEVIEVDDGAFLSASLANGVPYIFTKGESAGITLRRKNYYGYAQVQTIARDFATTWEIVPASTDSIAGQVAFGINTANKVWTFGTPFPAYTNYSDPSQDSLFPNALNQPYVTAQSTIKALTSAGGKLFVATKSSGSVPTYQLEYFSLAGYTSYRNALANFQTIFVQFPEEVTIDWIRFRVQPITTADAKFTPVFYVDMDPTALTLENGDITSTTLDANGNEKTYYDIGKIASSIAIGGNWANSTANTSTVVITKIDVGYTEK